MDGGWSEKWFQPGTCINSDREVATLANVCWWKNTQTSKKKFCKGGKKNSATGAKNSPKGAKKRKHRGIIRELKITKL